MIKMKMNTNENMMINKCDDKNTMIKIKMNKNVKCDDDENVMIMKM